MTKKIARNLVTTSPMQVRVVAYIRVSTAQQASSGESLEAQKMQLQRYADAFGYLITAYEVDAGLSASSLERPGLQAALGRLERFEAEGLLVMKLDRLTRSVRDLCILVDNYFRDGQSRLLSVHEHIDTSSAGGRMILNVLTSISQWEREAAAERTSAVMQHLKATGRHTGGFPPFGYTVDDEGNLVPNVEETAMILRARALREKRHSFRAIACALGNNPRNGKPFHTTQIVRMMEAA